MGRPPHLRLPGRRDQRLPRRLRPRRRRPGADPGPPRGDGGLHGVRPREVHRRGRRLHRHLGPGRDPPPERALRREARPPARSRDRRPAGDGLARRQLPAGGRPGHALQGRRARVRAHGDRPGADPAPGRPRDPHRARPAHGDVHHRPERPRLREGGRGAAAQARHDPLGRRLLAAEGRARGGRPRARRGGAEREREGRDAGRPGCAARRRRGRADSRDARRGRGQGAARQGRAARRPAVRDRLDRPARDEAELGSDDGLRRLPDGRLELPVLGVPASRGQGARRPDRPRRPHGRDPLPDGGQPRRRRQGDAGGAAAEARAQGGPLLARGDRARSRSGGS